ncbi:MAG: alkaline phosphatase [Paracoccaceae bacterium]
MLRMMLAAALLFAAPAAAQTTIAQADNPWFTDADAQLAQNLRRQPNTSRAKNVILFIADGNSVGANYATRIFAGQRAGKLGEEHVLPYEAFPHLALSKTYNINAQTPDSAATASALNSGVKARYLTLGVSEEVIANVCATYSPEMDLTLLSDIAAGLGKSIGIVTTTRLTHATPAAVYAHSVSRRWEGATPKGCAQKDIAAQLFDAMADGRVDLAFGGGRRFFGPEGAILAGGAKGRRKDGRDLIEEARAAGWRLPEDGAALSALTPDGAPVLGVFADSHLSYEEDRTDEPSLTEMTVAAIRALSANEGGFYLMVEGGRVDHGNHGGVLHRTVSEGAQFAAAVAMADALTDDGDTLIVVTADHGHSLAFNGYCGRGSPITGLCYEIAASGVKHDDAPNLADDGKPYSVAGYLNGPGAVLKKDGDVWSGSRPDLTQEQATGPDYRQQALIPKGSATHSGEDVAIYAKGPWAHLFDGTVEQNYVFHVMNHAMGAP